MRKLLAMLTAAAFALTVVPAYAADEKKADAPKTEKKAAAAKTEKPKTDAAKADKPKGDKPKQSPEDAFKRLDKDGDGSITEAEFVGKVEGEKAAPRKAQFAARDTNKDGKISLEEFKTPAAKKPKAPK